MDTVLIILAAGTFLIATLTFFSSVTDWFKKTIPIQYGFLIDDMIKNEIHLSTGDPAKTISLRFHNTSMTTLTGVVFDIRFLKPIALSGSPSALSFIPDKTTHGRTQDKSYYLIRHSELQMAGQEELDFRVELNTEGKTPGTYKALVTAYTTQKDYKYKKSELLIKMT